MRLLSGLGYGVDDGEEAGDFELAGKGILCVGVKVEVLGMIGGGVVKRVSGREIRPRAARGMIFVNRGLGVAVLTGNKNAHA